MPEWLPNLLTVMPWSVPGTYDMLYSVFCSDIRDVDLRYETCPVWFFNDMEDGREKLFWHLTSRENKAKLIPRRKRRFYPTEQTHDPQETERFPDMRRCERLNWVKPLLDHPCAPEMLAWDYEEGDGVIKTYLWIKEYDFLVVMKKYANGTYRLITSFYVDKHNVKVFKRKYNNRIK